MQDQFARNAEILKEFRSLRMQNVKAQDACNFLAEKYSLTPLYIVKICSNKEKQAAGVKEAITGSDPLQTDFNAFGTSTLYDAEGNVKLQWVKRKKEEELERFREIVEGLAEPLPRVPARPAKAAFKSDTIAVYPMGDPHIGMYAWAEEAGADFDLKIAERNLCVAVDRLVNTVPACESALIINLGDFFHADNLEGRTTRSNNILDTDTRYSKVLRVGIKAMRQCIESALEAHKHVTVINAIGNHDDQTSMCMSVTLANIYENEPRVTINDAPTIKHYHRFGKNIFGVHHGHTIKMQDLPYQMAIDRASDWAECPYRFIFTGHVHHDQKKEYGGVIVESFRTLAAKDAWHASMGYHAGRDMKAILFHKDFGEIERHTVSVEML